MQKKNSGILLSGGMDSISLAYWLRPKYAFTIDYGHNSAKAEIHAATQVSKALRIIHQVISVDCSSLGSGNLSDNPPISVAPVEEWWPYRNQLLVTLACMRGVSLGLSHLIVGSVRTDGSHADGTPVFYEMLSKLIEKQEGNIEIECPAINMDTVELIRKSKIPLSILLWSHSCHKSNQPCMNCNGCMKYLSVLQKLDLD